MKYRLISIFAAAAAILAVAACNKEQEFDPGVMSIAVQPDSLVVKAIGGTASFTFDAPDYWFVSSPVDWLTFEPESGKPGQVTLVVKTDEYHVAKQRSAVITINAKGRKGQCKIIQEAGEELPPPPDYSGTWSVIGTLDGSDWDKDFEMSSTADLVWEAKIPYTEGNEFKFRMNGDWATNMGIDGDLSEADGVYKCNLKQDGGNITLSTEGYWNLTLDLNSLTMAAVFDSEFPSPEPKPLPADWEPVWVNDGTAGEANWDSVYRFGLEGHDGNNECIATLPQDVWNRLKSETFYVYLSGANPQVRVTTGWWSASLTEADFQPGNESLTDNDAGTWILTLNMSEAADFLAMLDDQHLLLTGARFTVLGIYLPQQAPVPGGNVIWDQETVFDSWNATLVIPAEKFADAKEGDVIRVFISNKTGDYNPIYKHVDDWTDWADLQGGKTDAEGYFEAPIPASALDELKSKGLRFQGVGFTVVRVELIQPVSENVIWDQETAFDSWSATIAIPADKFADAKEGDMVRAYVSGKTGEYNPIFKHVDNWNDWSEFQGAKVDGEDYFEAPIPAGALDELKSAGLRFQGVGFTITKVVLM